MPGHDHGLVVFKMERERPAMTVFKNILYYVKDKHIRAHDLATKGDVPVVVVHRGLPGQYPPPRALSFNAAENSLLLTSDAEGGMYTMHSLPKTLTGEIANSTFDAKRGSGGTALFIARNKFAIHDKATQVCYCLCFN